MREFERRNGEDDRLREMARAAGKEAARDVLLPLGIDLDDGDSFREFTADLAYLRRSREASEKFYTSAKVSLVSAFLMAITGGVGWVFTLLWPPKH